MKFKKFMLVASAIGFTTVSLIAIPAAQGQTVGKTAADQIRWRQSAYATLGWSMARIKANLGGEFNKEQVVQAANTIQALAHANIDSLFPPGTDKGKGWKETEVKPEYFTDKAGVAKVWTNFGAAADDLAKAAASGDASAVKTQFGKVGEACKACHDKFHVKD
jgi:cytochrome c556